MNQTNDEFLAALRGLGLLPPEVVRTLGELVKEAKGDVQPRHLAKWLVDKGHLTSFQAKGLLTGKMGGAAGAARPTRPAPVEDKLEVVEDELETVEEELEVVNDEELEVIEDDFIQSPPPQVADEELEVVEEENLEVVEEDLMAPSPPPAPKSPWSRPAKSRPGKSRPAKPQTEKPRAEKSSATRQSAPKTTAPGAVPSRAAKSNDSLAAGAPKSAVARTSATRVGSRGRLKGGGKSAAKKGNVWDSPLLLGVGGTLLALVIVAGVLYWRINQGNADEDMRAAEEEYNRAAYSQAIELYDRYLKKHPDHEMVSLARVHRGLARLRQVVDASSDWQRALRTAKEVIDEIKDEKEFAQGHGELAAMLPKIANGLKEQARLNPEQGLVDQTNEAVALIRGHVPRAQQPHEQIQDIEASLALTGRTLAQADTLRQGLAEIRAAVEAGDPAKAYAVRNGLIKTYPGLLEDASLQEAVLAASQTERALIKPASSSLPAAETAEPGTATAGVATLILAARTGESAPGVAPGQVAYTLACGSAYALDAASGQVLWRRFVGFDTSFPPVAIEASGGGDALLIDSARHEVVRVEAKSGLLRWRQSLGGPLVDGPVVLRDRVLVAARSGLVASLDLETGAVSGAVQLPQSVRTPPTADNRQRKCYQVGEHSNLFILPVDASGCDEVIYLGHEAGTISAAPVVMGPYVVVVENTGVAKGLLKVLKTNEEGLGARLVQQISLNGHVLTPPLASGKNLLVATDRGGLLAFEVGAGEKGDPLTPIAEKAASDGKSLQRFISTRGAQFWLADRELTMYDVQAAKGLFAPRWVKFPQDVFIQAPLASGEFLITARRRAGRAGVTVAAVRVADGTTAWETQLGAPAAGRVAAGNGGQLSLLTSAGALFQVPASDVTADRVIDQPLASVDVPTALPASTSVVTFPGDIIAFSSDALSEQVLLYNPEAGQRLRLVTTPSPPTGRSEAFGDGLLLACQDEMIVLLDPRSAKSTVEPFQPRQEAGTRRRWTALAVEGGQRALAADDLGNVFLLAVDSSPSPHLAATKEARLEAPLVSGFAILGSAALAVDDQDRLVTLSLPDLAASPPRALGGHVVWGPRTVGDIALMAIEPGELAACDSQGQELWKTTLALSAEAGSTNATAADQTRPRVTLAGPPLATPDGLLVAVTAGNLGAVVALSAEDGSELGRVELQRPLAGGPVVSGDRIVVPGSDGCLYSFERAAMRAAAP
jgi:outer membrane protein assembly factor BamB